MLGFVFSRGVNLTFALGGIFEQCSNVPLYKSMILIIILGETRGSYN